MRRARSDPTGAFDRALRSVIDVDQRRPALTAAALATVGPMELGERSAPAHAHVPTPASERGHWLLAGTIAALGLAVLAAVLTGLVGASTQAGTPPPVAVRVATPAAARPGGASTSAGERAVASAHAAGQRAEAVAGARPQEDFATYYDPLQVHVSRRWMEGFYPIYSAAQSAFGVNWLLIASIHRQETAFSTAPGTYEGLNSAGCCGGPMQFNVRNGPVTTWNLVSDSYRYGARPAVYDHRSARHPSIYDDFDAIMAAAHLLSSQGARMGLEGAAWNAAYDYNGGGLEAVTYADQVLARAIGWSQHGFCINCGLEPAMVQAVHAAYGAPVQAALEAAAAAEARAAASEARASKRKSAHDKHATRASGTRQPAKAQAGKSG
jgi:hypothetical protein